MDTILADGLSAVMWQALDGHRVTISLDGATLDLHSVKDMSRVDTPDGPALRIKSDAGTCTLRIVPVDAVSVSLKRVSATGGSLIIAMTRELERLGVGRGETVRVTVEKA
jgi:hypothetical protein